MIFLKEGFITEKSGAPTEAELEKINRLSRRILKADEVFVFSVVLCDNDVDRDFERFSEQSLKTLAALYIGKTGIFDHSCKGRDQVARIFDTQVEYPDGQQTKTGERYCRLKARAYMPNTAKNADMIAEIDAGIKKEVSVGCAVAKAVCSVCGKDQRESPCSHRKGRFYGSGADRTLCYYNLEQPTDAYEWSFVAVPAQPKAGVTKGFSQRKGGEQMKFDQIEKELKKGSVTFTEEQCKLFREELSELKKLASFGKCQLENLRKEVSRLGGITNPDIGAKNFEKFCENLEPEKLFTLKKLFEDEIGKDYPLPRQVNPQSNREKPQNDKFII